MNKKVLMSFVLLTLVGASLVFAQAPTLDKLTLSRNSDASGARYVVTARNKSISGEVVIPETHEGLRVNRINGSGFLDCTGITGIIIPNSITEIQTTAFRNCTGLTNVTIPASVESIGNIAFNGCTNLTSVTFMGTVSLYINTAAGSVFPGDLKAKYEAANGGPGTYTRQRGSDVWTKQSVNLSLDSVWQNSSGNMQITANGSTATFSNFGSLNALQQDAVNKGYIKLGDQYLRNLSSTGNLRWSGQALYIDWTGSNTNATGTHWANSTITMSADGGTIDISGGGGTWTRKQ